MDTTYINTILVVFLVAAALAIDVGYMYVSEEDLHNAAETSALAGTEAMKQRVQQQIHADPQKLDDVLKDRVQANARAVAMEMASGKHRSVALVEIANDNSNTLTTRNDITVGFWNTQTDTYTAGATPVNAMQVRTRRTAESETVGLGSVGTFLAKISGVEKFDYTPEAISALPARANANVAICADACDSGCEYPKVCTIPERKMISGRWNPETGGKDRFAFTTLHYQVTATTKLSDLICLELPPQEVCGSNISTIQETGTGALRDLESMLYNPNIDKTNKEYDKNGVLLGWWVIAPVTECPPAKQENTFEQHGVTKYALLRISRICASGPAGCQQNGTSFKSPPSACSGGNGLYIDRLSYVDCGSDMMKKFPGLHPVIVK